MGGTASSGSATVNAVFDPNTINLSWYNDGVAVANAQSSCIYDTTITPPTLQSKTGYTFGGWRVNPLKSVDIFQSGNWSDDALYAKQNGIVSYDAYQEAIDNGGDPSGLSPAEYGLSATDISSYPTSALWGIQYDYGNIGGIAICNTSSSDPTVTTAGEHCWCNATKYKNGGAVTDLTSNWYSGDLGGNPCTEFECVYACMGDFGAMQKYISYGHNNVTELLGVYQETNRSTTSKTHQNGTSSNRSGTVNATYSWGTVAIDTMCSTSSSSAVRDDSNGTYCWFRVTNFTPTGSQSVGPSEWMYWDEGMGNRNCWECSQSIRYYNIDWRRDGYHSWEELS